MGGSYGDSLLLSLTSAFPSPGLGRLMGSPLYRPPSSLGTPADTHQVLACCLLPRTTADI